MMYVYVKCNQNSYTQLPPYYIHTNTEGLLAACVAAENMYSAHYRK